MRRIRLPSDSPSIVTRPGVNRTSMALWVTSIQDGCASGRQLAKIKRGRPAFSSANICSTFFAASSFHGGGLLLTCASWSVIFGFHTPLQSGNLARSAQSCAVGGGLMMVGVFFGGCGAFGACARASDDAETSAAKPARTRRVLAVFTRISPKRADGQFRVAATRGSIPTQLMLNLLRQLSHCE